MSEELKKVEAPKVYQAINNVSNELLSGIQKGSKNQMQGFMFRGIDAVYNALSPALVKHKLVIAPRIKSREVVERKTARGGALFYVVVEAEFDFISSEDGSIHTVTNFGEAMDSGDKATNKAMSIAYKYAAFQTFCIPTEDTSIDPDSEVHDVAPQEDVMQYIKDMSNSDDLESLKHAFGVAWSSLNDPANKAKIKEFYDNRKGVLSKDSEDV